jgi:hypothetical protein
VWNACGPHTLVLDGRHDALLAPVDPVGQVGEVKVADGRGEGGRREALRAGSGGLVAEETAELRLGAVGQVVDALLPGLGRVGVVGADLGQAGLEGAATELAFLGRGVDLVEFLGVRVERIACIRINGGRSEIECRSCSYGSAPTKRFARLNDLTFA